MIVSAALLSLSLIWRLTKGITPVSFQSRPGVSPVKQQAIDHVSIRSDSMVTDLKVELK